MTVPFLEENDQTVARRAHLEALRALVGNVYPNKFERSDVTGTASHEDTITSIVQAFKKYEPEVAEGEKPSADILESANNELNKTRVRVAGRIAAPPRVMGKAAFLHLSDGVSRLQIYIRRQDVVGTRNHSDGGEVNGWDLFGLLDHGDFIGAEGYLFITKTGELSVHAEKLQFLAKALLPMPDKMHGIHDPEIRQRQRYADLIAGSLKLESGVRGQESGQRAVTLEFQSASHAHSSDNVALTQTHSLTIADAVHSHTASNIELNPRQTFELRSKVIREIRRFLDDHGYVEVETPMLTPKATGALAKPFKTHHNALDIDLYARIAPELYLKRLVVGGFEKVYELNRNFRNEGISTKHNPEFTMLEFYWAYADVNQMMDLCEQLLRSVVYTVLGHTHVRYGEHVIDFSQPFERISMRDAITRFGKQDVSRDEKAERIVELFEELAEPHLIQPTFITDFPKPISPLSKASPADPSVAERFEYFVAGIESANGFSELNDPEEQYQRFKEQGEQRERGDEEAMVMDEDYIRALSYGMPPAAGIGVGIDRLVMLLANKHSIRDVILFPHMRPEKAAGKQGADGSSRSEAETG